VALQIAAHAAKSGQTKFAIELKELVEESKLRRTDASKPVGLATPTPLQQPRGELSGILAASYPDTKINELVQRPDLLSALQNVLKEQRQRSKLQEFGFRPVAKILLEGPPGTGKSMTAGVIAGELRLPLFTIQLDGLITKYLGETASKLRLVFDTIESTRGVYLFDEFDAIAANRDSSNEMGEIKRVVNSFLQFLESHRYESLVIAATNHPQLLDRAMFRRFDTILHYDLPDKADANLVMKRRLSLMDTSLIDWSRTSEMAVGLSHAELTLACEEAAKWTILDGSTQVQQRTMEQALGHRHRFHDW
jgi:SpoVK/Ycf46/Vps4 family AAA+-type ATPase